MPNFPEILKSGRCKEARKSCRSRQELSNEYSLETYVSIQPRTGLSEFAKIRQRLAKQLQSTKVLREPRGAARGALREDRRGGRLQRLHDGLGPLGHRARGRDLGSNSEFERNFF